MQLGSMECLLLGEQPIPLAQPPRAQASSSTSKQSQLAVKVTQMEPFLQLGFSLGSAATHNTS